VEGAGLGRSICHKTRCCRPGEGAPSGGGKGYVLVAVLLVPRFKKEVMRAEGLPNWLVMVVRQKKKSLKNRRGEGQGVETGKTPRKKGLKDKKKQLNGEVV